VCSLANRAKADSDKDADRVIGAWAKRLLTICDKKITNFVLQSTNLQVGSCILFTCSPICSPIHTCSRPLRTDGVGELAFLLAPLSGAPGR
jgi:hypothetical protein